MKASRCIAILGAGPAGLSAALWLRNLGFEPRVLDASAHAGGLQNLNYLGNDWVLGQMGQTGPMLATRFVEHAAAVGIAVETGARPVRLSGGPGSFRLRLDSGQEIGCVALIVATGTRYRAEEVLAEVEGVAGVAPGRIAYGPHAFADLGALAGKRVLIVGGGDNAFENARLLAPNAAAVHLAVRSRPRAQQRLTTAVADEAATGRCHLLQAARVLEIKEGHTGAEVTLAVAERNERIVVDHIHVLAGYEPNTAFINSVFPAELRSGMHLDTQGYLVVDVSGHTGEPGIYAAGDVCNPHFPSVVSAIAQGAVAAKTIEMDTRTW